MEIPCPFLLTADSGELSLDGFQARFGPQMTVSDFEVSDLNSLAVKVGSEYPYYHPVFQIKNVTLQDGRWAYLHASFKENLLVRLGFGWGMVREYGFHETTSHEFQEQLHSYCTWLESMFGSSLLCVGDQRYRKGLPWGKVEASVDARTGLAGIGILFTSFPSADLIEVARVAYELGMRHGKNAFQYAQRLAGEALSAGQAQEAGFWQVVSDHLKTRSVPR
jgi:hypothetical protein